MALSKKRRRLHWRTCRSSSSWRPRRPALRRYAILPALPALQSQRSTVRSLGASAQALQCSTHAESEPSQSQPSPRRCRQLTQNEDPIFLIFHCTNHDGRIWPLQQNACSRRKGRVQGDREREQKRGRRESIIWLAPSFVSALSPVFRFVFGGYSRLTIFG